MLTTTSTGGEAGECTSAIWFGPPTRGDRPRDHDETPAYRRPRRPTRSGRAGGAGIPRRLELGRRRLPRRVAVLHPVGLPDHVAAARRRLGAGSLLGPAG